ncbi:MAG: isopentenyl-diphosphate Delta-isomerase [Micropruina sp.]|nr:isopentenyl-diphosphate Delta-isomerase [Micropruina sp.]
MLHRLASGDAVVLLDEQGNSIGFAPRLDVHTDATPLHLAFSSYLFDEAGRLLLTRRALHKRTWPGVWTNSCCGHPLPEESQQEAVRRRVDEELGLSIEGLTLVLPEFRYRAVDASGVVENELCPVWVGRVCAADLRPDPSEVAEHAWVAWPDLVRSVRATPQAFSPWAVLQVPQVAALVTDDGTPLVDRLDDLVAPVPDEVATVAAVDALVAGELSSLRQQWSSWVPDVEVLAEDLPTWLGQLAALGGKRFRPRLGHWAYVACGGRPGAGYDTLVRATAALELLHLFALVHDDVMDESASRRGAPSAHVQAAGWHRAASADGDPDTFGRNLAILLGDLAHARAARLADELPDDLRTTWHELCLELIAGQRADLTGAAAGRRDREHAERIARLKSGSYSVSRPLQLGAMAAGADAEQLALLEAFGDHVGRAFALRDDLLGLWGDPAVTGKPAGDDLRSGKATVILALASETLTGPDAALLQHPDGRVDEALAALQRAGVEQRVECLIGDEVRSARTVLAGSGLRPEGIAGLLDLAGTIAWRRA